MEARASEIPEGSLQPPQSDTQILPCLASIHEREVEEQRHYEVFAIILLLPPLLSCVLDCFVFCLPPSFPFSLLFSFFVLIFKDSPKIQFILAVVFYLEIWKILWVPKQLTIVKFKLMNSHPIFLFVSLSPFLSPNVLSRFIFKGSGTLDSKTSGLFQGAGCLPDQQCKYPARAASFLFVLPCPPFVLPLRAGVPV